MMRVPLVQEEQARRKIARSVIPSVRCRYLLHETGVWSPVRREWLFLPRRMSKEPYQDVRDEKKGANTIITADENFDNIKYFRVGTLTPERGFSSAKFVPGSQDNVVVALKSEEDSAKGLQASCACTSPLAMTRGGHCRLVAIFVFPWCLSLFHGRYYGVQYGRRRASRRD